MSSSSSDSDSDDLEPIRRIKINIKPKEDVRASGADVDAIKASVEAWRPLGPRPHRSLTRRQSSLSSVSSMSFGTSSNQGVSGSTTATSSTGFNYTQHGSTSTATRGNIYSNTDHTSNTFMRSSPSCSSLVNEFSNRTSFTNFMSNASRTSSPLTFMNNYGDTVPIALAIQESIELTVKGHQRGPGGAIANQSEIKFDTRALGNIKVAIPNAFARSCSHGYKPNSILKLRLDSTNSILRYYASGLIRDLDSESSSLTGSTGTNGLENELANAESESSRSRNDFDLFDMNESPSKTRGATKMIEFDMDALMTQLKQQYDQSPNGRYYNVDALRYQIAPVDRLEKCPIQVCAYWRIEPKLIKLRLDFKHSNQSGFNLERLREIVFSADLSNLIPSDLIIEPVSANAFATMRPNKVDNNNLASFRNLSQQGTSNELHRHQQPVMQHSNHQYRNLINVSDTPSHELQSASSSSSASQSLDGFKQPTVPAVQIRLPPPPSKGHSRGHNTLTRNNLNSSTGSNNSLRRQQYAPLQPELSSCARPDVDLLSIDDLPPTQTLNHDNYATFSNQNNQHFVPATMGSPDAFYPTPANAPPQDQSLSANQHSQAPTAPYITYEPQAHWDQDSKLLTWKFDNLLSYYKTDGYGSLLAKVDFRTCPVAAPGNLAFGDQQQQQQPQQSPPQATPKPVDVKFMVVDATISKISLSVVSTGYRMSLLKKEVRSGRYRSEPNIS